MSTFETWGAIRAAKSRIGKWRGFETWRALDPTITSQQWERAWNQATAALSNRVAEITRPLNRRPTPSETTQITSVRARGFQQFVNVFVRDPETGLIDEAPYALRTDTLRSRLSVINEAMVRFESATTEGGTFEGQEIVEAHYSGTIELIPR